MQVETASMLRCCQQAHADGDDELQARAKSVLSYMQFRIMDRVITLPEAVQGAARKVIAAAMEADDG